VLAYSVAATTLMLQPELAPRRKKKILDQSLE
jgi:hypothetical protein